MRIAYDAHAGQLDPCGVPYIFHPFHLAEQMDSEAAVCVALLHDVIEDTSVTESELRQEFSDEIVDAVVLMTHRESEDYGEYLLRIKQNSLALAVKKADVEHNSDESRLVGSDVPVEKIEWWRKKYDFARSILNTE